ncbi:MAG: LVIVD repeat-containing protein, partial [Methylobacter sp.]
RRNLPNFGMTGDKMHELIDKTNLEQEFHPIYNYAFITDAEEGLILTDVNTLSDGEPRNNFLERALTWNDNGILKGARHLTIGGRYFYVTADVGVVILDMDNPLKPKVEAVMPMRDVRASALQFRYLFVTDADGLKVVDVTDPAKPRLVKDALVPLKASNRIYVARTYAYVAAGSEGLAIVDVEKPEQLKLKQKYTAGGQISNARDVVVGTTNASLFAYVADGKNGLRVLQLTSPDSQPGFYGFSPEPRPELIATYPSNSPALSLSKGLDRDRAVDETGGQIAVMGRIGSRPFTSEEMKRLYLNDKGEVWTVTDEVEKDQFKAGHEK